MVTPQHNSKKTMLKIPSGHLNFLNCNTPTVTIELNNNPLPIKKKKNSSKVYVDVVDLEIKPALRNFVEAILLQSEEPENNNFVCQTEREILDLDQILLNKEEEPKATVRT